MKNILTLTFLLVAGFSFAQTENTWAKLGDFPGLKRTRAVGVAIGEKGYVGTGVDTAEFVWNDWWEYDPATDTWSQLENVPGVGRRSACAFELDGFAYVGVGINHAESEPWGVKQNDFYKYDPTTNAWTPVAIYPGGLGTGVYQATAFSAAGKGYVACGKIGADNYLTQLWEYDPGSNTWTSRPPFPGGDRHQLSSFAIDDYGYVGMGTDHDLYRKDWWRYDPATLSWTEMSDLPGTERASAQTFVLKQRAYVVFGSDGGLLKELWEYNPFTDSWNVRNSFDGSERKNGVAFGIGDTAYAGLGKGYSGKKMSWWKYYPVGPIGIEELEPKDIVVYPNPVTENSLISLPHEVQEGIVAIHSYSGQLIYSEEFTSNNISLSDVDFASGHYVVSILDRDHNYKAGTKLFVE